ncbi:nuclear transport factor 2 family protein [Streptomyces sp. B-S-A8]|uniref:Nuclear transport factor 2 family protein n=1 Tax=Streptomyces solicavernae TaxID=3043614 RepID=A0ABT6S1L4_9ACTN|nr:nuclear transport factor 2 family protein [Streptomyces sp. B-S-A8]MDI3389873.1 nuclear transport factor 2 family protein [Streptomyces sp. B-S-A8]
MYAEVAGFYARQMRRLDEGDAEGWADTFTEDAVCRISTRPAPMRGRAELTAGARAAVAAIAAAGEQRRHMTGMFEIEERPGGILRVHAQTIVYATSASGESRVHQVCVCADTLVRGSERELLVRDRRIDVDGVPAGTDR